jgi:hypothetical protein
LRVSRVILSGDRFVVGMAVMRTTDQLGLTLVVGDRRLRALTALACVNGFYVIPEGIAAQLRGAGGTAVGWLLAAIPAGLPSARNAFDM